MRSEHRRSQESLGRVLERIAGRLAKRPSSSMQWVDRRFSSRYTATVTAKRLWVAGSFARGAAECGDLDLILEVAIDGSHPPNATIKRNLLGHLQDASLYIGNPDRNDSYVSFPEARLVWSEEFPDGSANLAVIPLDPEAGRFARPTDQLPLRPDQVDSRIEELERLVEMKQHGNLEWEFIDAATVVPNPAVLARVDFDLRGFGSKSRDALWLGLAHHALHAGPGHAPRSDLDDRTGFRWGGTTYLTARPSIPLEDLDTPFVNAIGLIPHRSRRGPNGIWIIRRGPEHPLEQRFADCQAYYLTWEGKPIFAEEIYDDHRSVTTIDLFCSEAEASEAAEFEREFAGDENPIAYAMAGGTRLLDLMAGCDLITVDQESFPLSRAGQQVLPGAENCPASATAEIAAALARS